MSKEDEIVLVVTRDIIIPKSWNGINTEGVNSFEEVVKKNRLFKRRGDVENDPSFKQIIPYMIFQYQDKFFLMQRTSQADARLANMYSLGIGGHINESDLASDSIEDWARREFKEEVEYSGGFKTKPIGLLNDESNPVGQVHLGYVMLLEGDNEEISIKDEHKSGNLLTLQEMEPLYSQMETWSQIVFDYLKRSTLS